VENLVKEKIKTKNSPRAGFETVCYGIWSKHCTTEPQQQPDSAVEMTAI